MIRRALIAVVVASALCASSTAARAQTTGRFTLMDDYDLMTGPKASIDALFLRLYLKVENIGGKERMLMIDERSDLPALASAGSEPWSKLTGITESYPFNNRCRGLPSDAHPCQDLPIRNVTLGQLQQLAGFYDLYYQIGGSRAGETSYSIGRKTMYEAGLTTVDGIAVEHSMDAAHRFGFYGGLSPDPLTRLFSVDYQSAGVYYALQQKKAWVRLAATGQGYKFKPDLASVFNQDFLYLAKGVTLSAFAQIDVIPKAQDRLIYADFTFSPTSRYRVRLNVTRYRPVEFAQSPELFLQNVDPTLVTFWVNSSGLASRYSRPEIVAKNLWFSPVTSGKAVLHYVTASSFTPYVSATYQTRDIDHKSGEVVDLGVYTYTPHDIPIIGRAFVEYQTGWDFTATRLDAHLENEVTPDFAIGGGFDLISSTYPAPPSLGPIGVDDTQYWTKSAQTFAVDGFAHYDRSHGMSVFLDAQFSDQNRKPGSEATQVGTPEKSSTDLSVLAGFTYRFGAGAPE